MMHTVVRIRLWLVCISIIVIAATAGTQPAAAAPDIDSTACGGTNVPNLYCSFSGGGANVSIGPGSCNVQDACLNLGDNVTIGSNACTHTSNANVCTVAGTGGGSVTIRDNACKGSSACQSLAGGGGMAIVEAGACQGSNACSSAADNGGFADIGPGSCIGGGACSDAGNSGSFTVGRHSCEGTFACSFAGGLGSVPGLAIIGDYSCIGDSVCDHAGEDGQAVIGSYSCSDVNSHDCSQPDASIGDCEVNSYPEPDECNETIELREYLFPFWDGGRFYLAVDGIEENLGPYGQYGNTGTVGVDPGNYTISETGANTSLANYRTTVICYERDGSFVAYGFGPGLALNVGVTDQITCTFINQRIWSWFWWR
jgi:hypothetical protein